MSNIKCSGKAKLCQKIRNSNYPGFYKKVWLECLKIPRGHLSTYSEIAKNIGNPKSARAVGQALAKNPFAPEVPCHKVIRKNGKLGGYSKGIAKKIKLLKKELTKERKICKIPNSVDGKGVCSFEKKY